MGTSKFLNDVKTVAFNKQVYKLYKSLSITKKKSMDDAAAVLGRNSSAVSELEVSLSIFATHAQLSARKWHWDMRSICLKALLGKLLIIF